MGPRTGVRAVSGTVLVAAGVVLVWATNRDAVRCGQDCYGAPAVDYYGSRTFEPGHTWTAYADSWQWGAQVALAWIAAVAAVVAVALAVTDFRRPHRVISVALGALVAYVGWVALSG